MTKIGQVLFCACLLSPGAAYTQAVSHSDTAKLMSKSFICSVYAVYIGDEDAAGQLFDKGMQAAREFVSSATSGKVSDEEWHHNIPLYINRTVSEGGPSMDFVIGRIYEQASVFASDDVIKKDASGATMKMENWRLDPGAKKNMAKIRYEAANCWAFLK